jgi:hypothetical protein
MKEKCYLFIYFLAKNKTKGSDVAMAGPGSNVLDYVETSIQRLVFLL